jgi:hypothetical protein
MIKKHEHEFIKAIRTSNGGKVKICKYCNKEIKSSLYHLQKKQKSQEGETKQQNDK